jgi:hypothetical protein
MLRRSSQHSAMPFRNVTEVDNLTLKVMTDAYDSVAARLKLKPDDPRTGKLAKLIVQLAMAGVTDADRLAEQARMGLK